MSYPSPNLKPEPISLEKIGGVIVVSLEGKREHYSKSLILMLS